MSQQDVIGLLPMGGSGTRLGLPFHKALAPTFTEQGIKPLYWHSVQQLLPVTGLIWGAGAPKGVDERLVGRMRYIDEPTMEATIQVSAKRLVDTDKGDAALIVALPDTIILNDNAIRDAYNWYLKQERPTIMPVLMHPADENQLDQLENDQFVPHRPGGKRKGWGALIGRVDWFAELDPVQPIAHQMNRTGFAVYHSQSTIFDLGTPERYESYIDVRKSLRG